MASKDYGQYCPMALALERLGERWTLLIVRDLLAGPRRYSDIQAGLPGIGTNILASRLKGLQEMGLVEKRELPPPAASTVYELTAAGHGLAPTLLELGKWGMQYLPETEMDPDQILMGLQSRTPLVLERGPEGEHTLELNIQGNPFTIELAPGRYEVRNEHAAEADVRVTASARTFTEMMMLSRRVSDAEAAGDATVEGDITVADDFLRCVGLVLEAEHEPAAAVGD